MKVVIQRVSEASVLINNDKLNKIDKGYVILLGIGKEDTIDDISYLVNKIIKLRIFEDSNNKMNLSLSDVNGSILLISQFTLYGDVRKNNRPSFDGSMPYIEAKELYDKFIEMLESNNVDLKTGEFGADMKVSLINDGPVTIIIDSKER